MSELKCDSFEALNIHIVLRAKTLSHKLLQRVGRNWGPNERLTLLHHAEEVEAILAHFGAPTSLRIAGLFHDIREESDRIKIDEAELSRKLHKYGQEMWPGSGGQFRDEVFRLIDAMTEPPKSADHDNWIKRKGHHLEQLRKGDHAIAMLSCAAKISGLRAGIKFHYQSAPTLAWSKGTLEENVWFHRQLGLIYRGKGVARAMVTYFEGLLEVFAKGPIEKSKAKGSRQRLSPLNFPAGPGYCEDRMRRAGSTGT